MIESGTLGDGAGRVSGSLVETHDGDGVGTGVGGEGSNGTAQLRILATLRKVLVVESPKVRKGVAGDG